MSTLLFTIDGVEVWETVNTPVVDGEVEYITDINGGSANGPLLASIDGVGGVSGTAILQMRESFSPIPSR
jgi:DNA uptake protein ComE-like DNA-binding protein